MNDQELAACIEGLLFALGKPMSRSELLKILQVEEDSLSRALSLLTNSEGRGVVLVDDGYMLELRVASAVSDLIERVRREENSRDLGRAGLEVLAAILYRGPLSRAEVDFIRGVNSSQTIRTLTTRGLVRKVQNPKDERSFLYEATTELLSQMGTTHPRDLPDFDAVRSKLSQLEASYRNTQTSNEAHES